HVLPPEDASASDEDAPPQQHEPPERSSTLGKGVRNTSAQAPSLPDAQAARPPRPSSTLAAEPRPPSPDATRGNTKRGASLSTPGYEHSRDQVRAPAPPPTKSFPLHQGLYVGSGVITEITRLDILVIPNGHQGTNRAIRDPGIDAKCLSEQFGRLEGVTVQSIPDDEVTLDRVKEAITALWEAAQPGCFLLVFLTGHGDDDNAMILPQAGRINELYLDELFQRLRQEHPKQLRVGVAFNICRENREKAAAEMHDVALIWACSLGQRAWAFKFQTLHEPSSVFLLALFIAAYDTYQGFGIFEDHFKVRVSQLARFNNHVSHVGDCEGCKPPYRFCHEAFIMKDRFRQDVDLGQSQVSHGSVLAACRF
ncbi:hypothetical protein FRC10_004879, partial [Ceratobasidium sp. 414]